MKPILVLPLSSTDLGLQPNFHSNVHCTLSSFFSDPSMDIFFPIPITELTQTVQIFFFPHSSLLPIRYFHLFLAYCQYIFSYVFRHCYKVHWPSQENAEFSKCFPTGDVNRAGCTQCWMYTVLKKKKTSGLPWSLNFMCGKSWDWTPLSSVNFPTVKLPYSRLGIINCIL